MSFDIENIYVKRDGGIQRITGVSEVDSTKQNWVIVEYNPKGERREHYRPDLDEFIGLGYAQGVLPVSLEQLVNIVLDKPYLLEGQYIERTGKIYERKITEWRDWKRLKHRPKGW